MSHIDQNRLREVAANDDAFFAEEEFHHVRECVDCFNAWAEFVRQFNGWQSAEDRKKDESSEGNQ